MRNLALEKIGLRRPYMLEAMSQGIPMLARDIAIMREASGDAVPFAASDPRDWAHQINAFTLDRVDALSAQSCARATHFSQKSMVDEYLHVLGLSSRKEGGA